MPLHHARTRLAAWALGAFVLLMLLSTALHPWVPAEPVEGARAVAGWPLWPAVHLVVVVAMLVGAAGFFALCAAVPGSPRLDMAGAALVWGLGSLAIVVSMVVELTDVATLAPRAAAGHEGAAAAFHAAHEASVFAFTLGLLGLTVAASAVVAVLHAGVLVPRWASTLGLGGMPFAVVVTFVALLLPDPARLLLGLGAMLLLLAWTGILAWVLLRDEQKWVPPTLTGRANP